MLIYPFSTKLSQLFSAGLGNNIAAEQPPDETYVGENLLKLTQRITLINLPTLSLSLPRSLAWFLAHRAK